MLSENRFLKIVALFRNSSISQIGLLALLTLPASGLAASNTLYPGQIYPVGGRPLNTAVGDLNNDGVNDIVTANFSGSVSVLLSAGDSFSSTSNYAAGVRPYDVALADMDGDNDTDIVTITIYSSGISVLLNNGDGTFAAATNYPATARSLALADMDGDSDIDIAIAATSVYVMFNNGTGSGFTSPVATGADGSTVVLADVNEDGDVDIVAVSDAGAGNVQLGNGDGTFGLPKAFTVGSGRFARLAVGNINNDGKLDIVTANADDNTISVSIGAGTGDFAAPQTYPGGETPTGIALADVDADGDLDAVTADRGGDNVSIWLNDGLGVFTAPVPYAVGNVPYSLALSDTNGDSAVGIIATNYGSDFVSILPNDGNGDFSSGQAATYATGDTVNDVAVADIDGDGALDIVTTNLVDDSISLLSGDNAGGFASAINYNVGNAPRAVALGDINGDSQQDIVTANIIDDSVSVLLATSSGFAAAMPYSVGDGPRDVILVDADGDGTLDVVTANFGSDDISVLSGDGTGGFGTAINYPDGDGPRAIVMEDVNNDGSLDIITANAASEDISILLNNGSGFAAATAFDAGDGPTSFAMGDINADGMPDIAIANFDSDNVSVLAGTGGGSFAAAVNYTVGDGPRGVELIDVNDDSKLDILTANANGNTISILLGDGAGGFSAANTYLAGAYPISIAVADMNADSRPDIAVANESDDSVSVLLQNNVAPVAGGGMFVVKQNGVATATLQAFDLNSDSLLFSIESPPQKGILTLVDAGQGSYNYAPATGFYGHDSFSFKASDGDAVSSEKTVNITVEKAADPAENVGGGAMSWPLLVLLVLAGLRKFKLTIMQGMNTMRFVLILLLAGFAVQAQATKVECADDGAGGFEADGHACNKVDLLSHMTIADLGGSDDLIEWVSDMWGWVDTQGTPDPMDDREYAIVGRFCGTSFVDITDPVNPVYLGNLPDHSEFVTDHNACAALIQHHKRNSVQRGAQKLHESDGSIWRDIKVYGHYAIIVAETNIGSSEPQAGMQIFDMHQLRGLVPASLPVQFQRSSYTHYDGFGNSHNVFINQLTGMAYAAGSSECNGGAHIVDITDPTNPVQAGCYPDAGYSHDIQCVIYTGPDDAYAGREICFGSNPTDAAGPNSLAILDVTDPTNIVQVAREPYPNSAYSHQGWLSEDQRYFFHNDEVDESDGRAGVFGTPNPVPTTRLLVWNVSDLDNPVLVTEFFGRTGATDHNNYVQGNYLYQSNYTAGLNILDVSDTTNPIEAGFFDNFIPYDVADADGIPNSGDEAVFDGTWSNYPWYPSGTVAVSDITGGLYLVKPDFGVDIISSANVNVSVRALDDEFEAAGDEIDFELIVENHGPDTTTSLNSLLRINNATIDSVDTGSAAITCTIRTTTVVMCDGLELNSGGNYVVEITAVTSSDTAAKAEVFATAHNVDIYKIDNTDSATVALKSEEDDEGEGEDDEGGDEGNDDDENNGGDDGGGSSGLLFLTGLLILGLLRRRMR